MRLLDLFSGIGGFSVGLEKAGFQTVAFCEIDPFCQKVLKKHWPEVPVYEKVELLTAERLGADGIAVDAICGGFPCQDISLAGHGAGLEGKRSGLWWEFHRLIKEIRPQVAIIENVSALRSRGLDEVLRSLAEIGYDAEWHCIPASAVGAPHRRDRIWIVAYPDYQHGWGESCGGFSQLRQAWNQFSGSGENMAYPGSERLQRHERVGAAGAQRVSARHLTKCSWWEVEPAVGRVVDGVPGRMDRLKSLGNAVVPQIPEMIGLSLKK